MIPIDFEWQRDHLGYVLVPGRRGPDEPQPTRSIIYYEVMCPGQLRSWAASVIEASAKSSYSKIYRRGGKLIRYRPFQERPGLSAIFAASGRSEQGLLDLINRFGPLTADGNEKPLGEHIRFGLEQAEAMYQLRKAPPNERAAYLMSRWAKSGLFCGAPMVKLMVNCETNTVQLRYLPTSLGEALWLELAQDVSTGRMTRECAYCGAFFDAGPGSPKRADARFCSNEHRTAFHNRARK